VKSIFEKNSPVFTLLAAVMPRYKKQRNHCRQQAQRRHDKAAAKHRDANSHFSQNEVGVVKDGEEDAMDVNPHEEAECDEGGSSETVFDPCLWTNFSKAGRPVLSLYRFGEREGAKLRRRVWEMSHREFIMNFLLEIFQGLTEGYAWYYCYWEREIETSFELQFKDEGQLTFEIWEAVVEELIENGALEKTWGEVDGILQPCLAL